jgi:hypothetical protein
MSLRCPFTSPRAFSQASIRYLPVVPHRPPVHSSYPLSFRFPRGIPRLFRSYSTGCSARLGSSKIDVQRALNCVLRICFLAPLQLPLVSSLVSARSRSGSASTASRATCAPTSASAPTSMPLLSPLLLLLRLLPLVSLLLLLSLLRHTYFYGDSKSQVLALF